MIHSEISSSSSSRDSGSGSGTSENEDDDDDNRPLGAPRQRRSLSANVGGQTAQHTGEHREKGETKRENEQEKN